MKISDKRGFITVTAIFILLFAMAAAAQADALVTGAVLAGKIFGWIKNGFFITYSLVVTFMITRKEKQCKDLMDKLKTYEKYWDEALIKKRVPEVFFKVKEAWTKRNQTLAKTCLSPALYKIYSMQTAAMKKRRETNVLDKIKFKGAQIVNIIDHKGSNKDEVWVRVKGAMLDYTVSDKTGALLEGNKLKAKAFAEVWKFIRSKKHWVLNEVESAAGFTEISAMKPSSDEVKG